MGKATYCFGLIGCVCTEVAEQSLFVSVGLRHDAAPLVGALHTVFFSEGSSCRFTWSGPARQALNLQL